MDTLTEYRQIIEQTLDYYVKIKYSHGEIQNEAVFDQKNDRYLVISNGWDGYKRIHGVLIHLDIIDCKVWVQRDGTEEGIANDLIAAGIPKDKIVLAFHHLSKRPYTGFAVA